MSIETIAVCIVLFASFAGLIYGVVNIITKKKALYIKMVALAVACITISYLYYMLQIFTRGEMPVGFNVGMLGIIGCFLFLLSANYGQMDSLADDGTKKFAKYRFISLIAPIILAIIFIQVYFTDAEKPKIVSYTLVAIIIMAASRFHLKHLIFPDVDFGVIRCIRGYNIIALILCVSTIFMMVADCADYMMVYLVSNIIMAGCCIVVLPVLKREVAKWTI